MTCHAGRMKIPQECLRPTDAYGMFSRCLEAMEMNGVLETEPSQTVEPASF